MSTLVTKQRCLAVVVAITSAAAAIHCSAERAVFDGQAPVAPPPPPPPAPFADASTGEASVPEPDFECADTNKQIYVLSSNDKILYRFDPLELTFTPLGRPACGTRSGMYSMAVDRRGIAWIEYADGRLFKVNTADMSCTDSGFRRDASEFGLFGMGFAKNDGDTDTSVNAGETLWVAGATLARLDTTSLELSLVGTGGLGRAELSGTGTGELWAFMNVGGRVALLDKETGKPKKMFQTGIGDIGAWAFAAWGGDLWLFSVPYHPNAPSSIETSTVTKYSPATDTTTTLMENVGLNIVGAGVSTCAPTEPPR